MSFKDNLTRYAGGVIVPLVALAIGLFAYFVMLPRYKSLQAARAVVKEKRAFVAQQDDLLEQVKQLIAEYQDKKEKLQPVDESLPTAPRIPELLANLDQISLQSGVQIGAVEIVPAPTLSSIGSGLGVSEVKKTEEILAATENLTIVQISIKLTGTYQGLKTWLKNAEGNLRLLDARAIVADEVDDKSGAQEFNLKINAYYQSYAR